MMERATQVRWYETVALPEAETVMEPGSTRSACRRRKSDGVRGRPAQPSLLPAGPGPGIEGAGQYTPVQGQAQWRCASRLTRQPLWNGSPASYDEGGTHLGVASTPSAPRWSPDRVNVVHDSATLGLA